MLVLVVHTDLDLMVSGFSTSLYSNYSPTKRSSLDYLMICGCYINYTGTVQQLRKFEATGDVCKETK